MVWCDVAESRLRMSVTEVESRVEPTAALWGDTAALVRRGLGPPDWRGLTPTASKRDSSRPESLPSFSEARRSRGPA